MVHRRNHGRHPRSGPQPLPMAVTLRSFCATLRPSRRRVPPLHGSDRLVPGKESPMLETHDDGLNRAPLNGAATGAPSSEADSAAQTAAVGLELPIVAADATVAADRRA